MKKTILICPYIPAGTVGFGTGEEDQRPDGNSEAHYLRFPLTLTSVFSMELWQNSLITEIRVYIPEFLDHTYTEISRYTKGSGIYRFMYESNHLIPGVHMTSDLSYLPDRASQFYGFNGYESVYNKDWMDDELIISCTEQECSIVLKEISSGLRMISRENFQENHLKWSAGFAFQNFKNSSVNIDKLNKGKETKLPTVEEQPGLFERYQELGLISENEADGGWVNTLKAGVMWDSRDNRPNPMKGLWTELGLEVSPKFMGNDWGFTRLYVIHRQYFTLIEKNLSFVYRVRLSVNSFRQSTILLSVAGYYLNAHRSN